MLAIGIHGQLVYMDKARDLVIVMLSSQPEPLDMDLSLHVLAALVAVASGLGRDRSDPDQRIAVMHPGGHTSRS